jgi:hypothetical protein
MARIIVFSMQEGIFHAITLQKLSAQPARALCAVQENERPPRCARAYKTTRPDPRVIAVRPSLRRLSFYQL